MQCQELTSRNHVTAGTGFPEARHSNAAAPPFLAVALSESGVVLTDAGTKISTVCI